VNDVDASDGTAAREVVTLVATEQGTRLEITSTSQLPDGVDNETRDAVMDGSRALLQLELDNIKRAVEGNARNE